MRVLIVGGAGYVGGALTDLLQAHQEHEIRVYDALLYELEYRKPIPFIYGDIRDWPKLRPHIVWADVIVWLAALVGDPVCQLNPDLSWKLNEKAVAKLAEECKKRIIFMSTCSVYGKNREGLTEESPTGPLSVYAETKLAAEAHLANRDALIFRLGTLYGVGDLFSRIRLDLVANVLTLNAHQTGKITVFGGEQFRPILHVFDVATAIEQQLGTETRGIFNLHDQNIRIIDLAHQVRMHFPDLVLEKANKEFEDARNYRVVSDKANKELQFKPSHTVDEGICELKALLEGGRIKDPDDTRYINGTYLVPFVTKLSKSEEV